MGHEGMQERRAAQRAEYAASALVYVGNERFVSRALNLSADGVLIIPPVRLQLRQQLRINLNLPALDQIVDVEGRIAREALVDGYYAAGVAFDAPQVAIQRLLETYVSWVAALPEDETRQITEAKIPPSAWGQTRKPGASALQPQATGPTISLFRPATMPGLQSVGTDAFGQPSQLEEGEALADLRRRYREALG